MVTVHYGGWKMPSTKLPRSARGLGLGVRVGLRGLGVDGGSATYMVCASPILAACCLSSATCAP
jgi:hypothetical protein